MFKKTLLAATLAALTTSAMAVDVDTSSSVYTFGAEAMANGFAKNDFTALQLAAIQLDLGAAYSVGDIIKINLAGGTFDPTDTFALVTSNAGVIEAGFLSATANQLVFRVTTATAGTAAEDLTLAANTPVKLDSISVGAKVTVTANAETSTGIAIDVTGATDSKDVITVIQQHKFAVTTPLSEKIDVANERKQLTDTSDTAVMAYTYVVPTFAATDFDITSGTGLKLTVNGSFTGFETGLTGSTALGTITLDAAAAAVAADLQSGSASVARPAASDAAVNFVFTPNAVPSSRVVLNTSSYTVDAAISDGTYTTTYAGVALGSFVLNGSSAVYAYAPVNFGGAVTTQFEIGNKGVVDGEITIAGFDTAGMNYSAVLPFLAEAGKLTRVSDADISTAFGLTAGTKLKLTFTVNAPNADITYGAYSNRGTTGRMAINKE